MYSTVVCSHATNFNCINKAAVLNSTSVLNMWKILITFHQIEGFWRCEACLLNFQIYFEWQYGLLF